MSTQTISEKTVDKEQLDLIFSLVGFDPMHDTVRVVEQSDLAEDGSFITLNLAGTRGIYDLLPLKNILTLRGLCLHGLRVGEPQVGNLLASLAELTFLEELDLSDMTNNYSDYRDDNAYGGTYDWLAADLSFLENFPKLKTLKINTLAVQNADQLFGRLEGKGVKIERAQR